MSQPASLADENMMDTEGNRKLKRAQRKFFCINKRQNGSEQDTEFF